MTPENLETDKLPTKPPARGPNLNDGENTKRIRMVREIGELVLIPEIENIVASALDEAKKKYDEKIESFKSVRQELEKELEEKEGDGTAKSKSYYFEMTRLDDPESAAGFKWQLGQFKLKPFKNIVDVIFAKLIEEIDSYKVAPNQVLVENVYSLLLDKWFQINFTKNSNSRVVGFVKIVEEKFVVTENKTMLTVNTKTYQSLQKEKVLQLMEENSRFCDYVSFYASLVQQTTRNPTN